MRKIQIALLAATLAGSAAASWYWPFGGGDDDPAPERRRLSDLMEPASLLIDEASDLAADGKSQEAVEKYRSALAELETIERENPERAASAEFATLRNKRAYVNAAIDSILLGQMRANAKAVAVSDTTALEKRLADEKKSASAGKMSAAEKKSAEKKDDDEQAKVGAGEAEKPAEAATEENPASATGPAQTVAVAQEKKSDVVVPAKKEPSLTRPMTRRERAMADIEAGRFDEAAVVIEEMLVEKPNGALALNLRAMMEAAQGKFKDAERTLDQAIMSNPRSHFAYYNMAALILQVSPDNKQAARRYYETGRAVGGPADEPLETSIK